MPYARSPVKALDVVIWIMLLFFPRCTNLSSAYFGFILPHPCHSYEESVPALAANTEEPVPGFVGHCLRGSEYLGLEAKFLLPPFQIYRKQ